MVQMSGMIFPSCPYQSQRHDSHASAMSVYHAKSPLRSLHMALKSPLSSASARERCRGRQLRSYIAASAKLRELRPKTNAHESGSLVVSSLHTIAYEVHGNPQGQPVLCVHGGPGAGAYASHARFFDSSHWRIILVDQRGCGSSTPRGCLEDNTTQALIQDFEKLREHLGVDTWVLFGGSWGTTLALAYAQKHTDRVVGLILRAFCLMRPQEVNWMYRSGATNVSALQPSAWDAFLAPLSQSEREDPLAAWYSRLMSAEADVRDKAASAWLGYDMAVSRIPSSQLQSWNGSTWSQSPVGSGPPHALPPLRQGLDHEHTAPPSPSSANTNSASDNSSIQKLSQQGTKGNGAAKEMSSFTAQAMLTAHYSINSAFLLNEPIIENLDRLRNIPAIGIQGRLDLVCPPATAFEVHQAWPELQLRLVGGAGHSQYDPAIQHELLEATDAMRLLFRRTSSRSRDRKAAEPHVVLL